MTAVAEHKLRIGVFMGGRSIEREVSFNSGRTICDHLDTQRYIVIPIFQTQAGKLYILPQHFLHRGKIADFYHRLDGEAQAVTWDQLKQTVDFVYLAVHGRYAEDGTIQGMLEVLKIPYLGTKVLGSALGMDKVMQKSIMAANGIDVARGITLTAHELESSSLQQILNQLETINVSFPVIVKPAHEGSSMGIAIVFNAEELMPALIKASTVDVRRKQSVLIEEKLQGMEFVCVSLQKVRNYNGMIQSEWFTFPITEVVIEEYSHLFDYEQKYMPGRALKITPARCTDLDQQRIAQACLRVTQLLHFSTISRIDGFLTDDGRVVIIDPNTLTGMSPSTFLFHQAAEVGMSHTDLINFLIENELHAYGLFSTDVDSQQKGSEMTAEQEKKFRIAVLLGGDSNEREISLESGRNVCYKLSPQKYEVTPVFLNDNMELFKIPQKVLIKNSTKSIALALTPDMQIQWSDLPSQFDFVFLGLHGGKGEGGAVQGALEMLDMPYNGSGVLASALCMDKYKTNNFLRAKGFQVPKNLLIDKADWALLDGIDKKMLYLEPLLGKEGLVFPLIVKPHDDGCSVMVDKAESMTDLCEKIDTYFTSPKTSVFIEELIRGFELTVGVIGNDTVQALPPSMAVAKGGILSIAEKFLPGEGENQTPAPLPAPVLELVKKTMVDAYMAVGCQGYCRIDCFYQPAEDSSTGQDRVVVLEFNTLPGLTPATCLFHQAAEIGVKPMELIDKIVELGFERYKMQHIAEEMTAAKNVTQDQEPESRHKKQDKATLQAAAHDDFTMKLF
jgi:UDP-N-acetylmuramate--alanine ligase